MRQTVVALALTIAVASRLAAQSAPDFSEVRRILREGMVRESAPAAAFAVVRDGEIIWEEAIGWADSANNLRTTAISSPVWDASHVTVRQLYTHMGGLSTFNIGCDASLPRERCHMPSADDMIREYGIVVLEPGQRFDYSNLG